MLLNMFLAAYASQYFRRFIFILYYDYLLIEYQFDK